jgi:ABC-type glycerol-3-phosphate transport system permease component
MPHRVAIHSTLIVLSLATVFPLLWMANAAFTPNELVQKHPFRFWPDGPTLSNFTIAASRHPIWAWLANSLVTAAAITLGKLVISVPAAFAFARLRFAGRETMFWLILATMSFPPVVAILPTYIAVVKLGAFDTYSAMIIPSIPYIGFYVFYFRQAFLSLPESMFEAARIDGAGLWRQMVEIALPNIRPALASLSVIAFLGAWNIYLWAQLVLEDRTKKTLITGVAMFADVDGAEQLWGPLMATNLLSLLPVLLVFLMAQRYLMEAFVPSDGER